MLRCIRHTKYTGMDAPELSCPSCCRIFIAEVKKRLKIGDTLPYWEPYQGGAAAQQAPSLPAAPRLMAKKAPAAKSSLLQLHKK